MVLQLYWLFGALQAITGFSLTIDTHLCMAILIFHAMHLPLSLITSMMADTELAYDVKRLERAKPRLQLVKRAKLLVCMILMV